MTTKTVSHTLGIETATQLRYRIKEAVRYNDISFAHVLLHSLAKVYNHTPHNVRMERLEAFAKEFPLLCGLCLKSCSQTGKKTSKALDDGKAA